MTVRTWRCRKITKGIPCGQLNLRSSAEDGTINSASTKGPRQRLTRPGARTPGERLMPNEILKLCECGCGQPAPIARQTVVKRGWVKGQSVRYVRGHSARKHETLARFEAKVDRLPGHGPNGDCHVWTAGCGTGGYGMFRFPAGTYGAHRVAWLLAFGEWPTLHVLHRCDNPPCVNPAHLFLGTVQDNTADMVAKGRHAHGERHPAAKLTASQVAEIRHLYGNERPSITARRYGVTQQAVHRIQSGLVWR